MRLEVLCSCAVRAAGETPCGAFFQGRDPLAAGAAQCESKHSFFMFAASVP